MSRPITRVSADSDTGHSPAYGRAVAWSEMQEEQRKTKGNNPSEFAQGPYAGSGDVLVGTEKLGVLDDEGNEIVGYGVHRQYDFRTEHVAFQDDVQPETGSGRLEGAKFPWLKTASDTVKVNGRGAGRKGDFTVCGAAILTGNDSVMVGGSDPDINLTIIPPIPREKIEEETKEVEDDKKEVDVEGLKDVVEDAVKGVFEELKKFNPF